MKITTKWSGLDFIIIILVVWKWKQSHGLCVLHLFLPSWESQIATAFKVGCCKFYLFKIIFKCKGKQQLNWHFRKMFLRHLLIWIAGKFNSHCPFTCVAFTDIEDHKEEIIEQFGNLATIDQQNWNIFIKETRRNAMKRALTQHNLINQKYS